MSLDDNLLEGIIRHYNKYKHKLIIDLTTTSDKDIETFMKAIVFFISQTTKLDYVSIPFKSKIINNNFKNILNHILPLDIVNLILPYVNIDKKYYNHDNVWYKHKNNKNPKKCNHDWSESSKCELKDRFTTNKPIKYHIQHMTDFNEFKGYASDIISDDDLFYTLDFIMLMLSDDDGYHDQIYSYESLELIKTYNLHDIIIKSNKFFVFYNKNGFNRDHRGSDHTKLMLDFNNEYCVNKKCSLYELADMYYRIKSHKFENNYELYCRTELTSSSGYIYKFKLQFDHGS